MSEHSDGNLPQAPSDQPAPIPEPIPTESEPRRRASVAVVLVAVVVALLLCCVCSVASVFVARTAFEGVVETFQSGAEFVRWSGDGRYAVIQTFTADEEPLVVVWDRETDETRTEAGYHVLAVEHFGWVAWLVPAGDSAAPTSGRVHPLGDSAPDELYTWDLSESSPRPADNPNPSWTAWPGPAELTVYPQVDASRGVYPSRLLIESQASPGETREVVLPAGFGTFDIVGWSPSGRFLALVERSPITEMPFFDEGISWWDMLFGGSDQPEETGESEEVSDTARILVVDAVEGGVVAEMRGHVGMGVSAAVAAWHPSDDVLFATKINEEAYEADEREGATRLVAIEPEGVSFHANRFDDLSVPEEWDRSWNLSIIGAGQAEVMILADESIWLMTPDETTQLGHLPINYGAVWHPDGGILILDEEWSDRDASIRTVVTRFDERGGSRESIWEGPQRPISIDGW